MEIKHTQIKEEYDYIISFREGRALVGKDGQVGMIDVDGELIIPRKYRISYEVPGEVCLSAHQLFLVEGLIALFDENRKCGYLDRSGNTVIPFEYERCRAFHDGVAAVQKNGKWGFIDRSNNTVIPFEYDDVDIFSEGLVAAQKNGKWGFIDRSENTVIPFGFDFYIGRHECRFSDGLAAVGKYGNISYIDNSGREILRTNFDFAGNFYNGIAVVTARVYKPEISSLDKQPYCYGLMDKCGNFLAPINYTVIYSLREGLRAAMKDGKCLYLSENGEEVLITDFDEVRRFEHGFAWVSKSSKWGVINKSGEIVLPIEQNFDSVGLSGYDGLFEVFANDKYGLVDIEGHIILPLEYDSPIIFNDGVRAAKTGNRWEILRVEC